MPGNNAEWRLLPLETSFFSARFELCSNAPFLPWQKWAEKNLGNSLLSADKSLGKNDFANSFFAEAKTRFWLCQNGPIFAYGKNREPGEKLVGFNVCN